MKLFEPFTIHEMTLQNRLVFPAVVSRLASMDGFVTKELKDRVLRIADGGERQKKGGAAYFCRHHPFI